MITLASGETVMMEVRRHWLVFFFQIVSFVIVAFLPVIAYGMLSVAGAFASIPNFLPLFFFASAWFLLTLWLLFFVMWTNYYLDVWIITNRRVIAMEQRTLFSREVAEFRLDKLQDVTIDVHGLLATFLHFGDISVQTAGEIREFFIKSIPHPEAVKEMIFRAHDALLAQKSNSS